MTNETVTMSKADAEELIEILRDYIEVSEALYDERVYRFKMGQTLSRPIRSLRAARAEALLARLEGADGG
jgi:hypothetical protein